LCSDDLVAIDTDQTVMGERLCHRASAGTLRQPSCLRMPSRVEALVDAEVRREPGL
jgi:hypothetical protein